MTRGANLRASFFTAGIASLAGAAINVATDQMSASIGLLVVGMCAIVATGGAYLANRMVGSAVEMVRGESDLPDGGMVSTRDVADQAVAGSGSAAPVDCSNVVEGRRGDVETRLAKMISTVVLFSSSAAILYAMYMAAEAFRDGRQMVGCVWSFIVFVPGPIAFGATWLAEEYARLARRAARR